MLSTGPGSVTEGDSCSRGLELRIARLVHTSLCSTVPSFTRQLSGSMLHAFAGR